MSNYFSEKVSPTIVFLGITFHSDSIGPPFQRHFSSKFWPPCGLQVTFDPLLRPYPINFLMISGPWIRVFGNCPLLDQRRKLFLNQIPLLHRLRISRRIPPKLACSVNFSKANFDALHDSFISFKLNERDTVVIMPSYLLPIVHRINTRSSSSFT